MRNVHTCPREYFWVHWMSILLALKCKLSSSICKYIHNIRALAYNIRVQRICAPLSIITVYTISSSAHTYMYQEFSAGVSDNDYATV